MSTHVLLNLLNELGKCEACGAFYYFLATSLINEGLDGGIWYSLFIKKFNQ